MSLDLGTRINYGEAFVHYCGGTELQDVAMLMHCDVKKLEARSVAERWPTLRARMEAQQKSLQPVSADEIARRAELIQQNREANLRIVQKLRQDAENVVDELINSKGEDMITQYWHNKGEIIAKRRAMTIAERATLATYLQTIAQISYAALGDSRAASGTRDDGSVSSSAQGQPGITIILPGVIAKPRGERKVVGNDTTLPADHAQGDPSGPVIDLRGT